MNKQLRAKEHHSEARRETIVGSGDAPAPGQLRVIRRLQTDAESTGEPLTARRLSEERMDGWRE